MKYRTLAGSLAALSLAVLVSACGGGGGGGGGGGDAPAAVLGPPPSQRFGASSQFEGAVAGCTLDAQKRFVRSYLDEVYLWYGEVPEVDPKAYATIKDYFDALLVKTPDANGLPRDRFSDAIPTSQPRAAAASSPGSYVPLVFNAKTAGGHPFGYIRFDDHSVGAQDQLISAFRQVRDNGGGDLVLDLRYNSGGYLYIALTAASMVTGPAANGAVFEQLRYNDKRGAETAQSALRFSSTVQYPEAQSPVGTPLPQLNLPRVFILTSGRTCSASESIINSLRGIDVQVIRIGTATCGKPYGFHEKDNCGWAFFPIEFQGTNAKGFGDYTTGFSPTCQVQDGSATLAGSAGDPLLTAARYYIDNNACPAGSATGLQSAATPIVNDETPARPAWAGRLLLPGQPH